MNEFAIRLAHGVLLGAGFCMLFLSLIERPAPAWGGPSSLPVENIRVISSTECVMLDASALNCATTDGCTLTDREGDAFDYTTADFDNGATEESGAWTFELPANLTGTTATWQAVWMSNNATCNGGGLDDVCWAIDGDSFADNVAYHGATLSGTVDGETDKCQTNGAKMLGPIGTFTHSMTAGERAVVTVTRDTDGTSCDAAADDDLAADASLLAIRFCYEAASIFSGEAP